MRVAVIGAGSWGTAVSCLCGRTTDTALWARRPELVAAITATRTNPDYLPGITLPDAVEATADLGSALHRAEVVAMAVPSHGFRDVLAEAAPYLRPGVAIISLTKGIERGTLLRMTEVIREVVPSAEPDRVGVLTGPNLSLEVAQGQPTAAVVAIGDAETAVRLQRLLMGPTFRVYTNPDVVGCESAGALKNVMAIAAGMTHGLGYGDNSMAALVTRALAELTRLGIALGGNPLTFAGLAGMGDLVATCFSPKSRNRRVGVELGRGRPLADVIGEMKMVAEGVKTTEAVLALADRYQVDMPIARMVGAVINDGKVPAQLVEGLMTRQARAELHGIE